MDSRSAISGLTPLDPVRIAIQGRRGDAKVGREFATAQVIGLEIDLGNELARMGRIVHGHE